MLWWVCVSALCARSGVGTTLFTWGPNPLAGDGGISYQILVGSSDPGGGSAYNIDFRVQCTGSAFGDQGTYDSDDDVRRAAQMAASGGTLTETTPRWFVTQCSTHSAHAQSAVSDPIAR